MRRLTKITNQNKYRLTKITIKNEDDECKISIINYVKSFLLAHEMAQNSMVETYCISQKGINWLEKKP